MIDIVVSKRADQELREIWRYIAQDSPASADRILLKIDAKLQLLREFPKIGTLRTDIGRGARMLVEGNYLLLYDYREREAVVELVSVVDGRRDLAGLY